MTDSALGGCIVCAAAGLDEPAAVCLTVDRGCVVAAATHQHLCDQHARSIEPLGPGGATPGPCTEDPTARDAVANVIAKDRTGFAVHMDGSHNPTNHELRLAADICAALNLDPDAPLPLIHWRAQMDERDAVARWLRTRGLDHHAGIVQQGDHLDA